MFQIPAQITNQFGTYIAQQGIPPGHRRYYVKWMRYSLDFCHTYHFEQGTSKNLSEIPKQSL